MSIEDLSKAWFTWATEFTPWPLRKPRKQFPLTWRYKTWIAPLGSFHMKVGARGPAGYVEQQMSMEKVVADHITEETAADFWLSYWIKMHLGVLLASRYAVTAKSDSRKGISHD